MNARQKNLVTLLAATLVAGGLGLYAYFGVMKPEEKEAERKAVEETVFAVHAPGEHAGDGGTATAPVFTAITVDTAIADGSQPARTVMELKNGVWRITSPVSARANKSLVDVLTQQLSTAKFKSTLEENPSDADLERYGLKPPRATVSVKAYVPDAQGGGAEDPARQRTLTFYTGLENTFDGSVYLRREGDPRVYTAAGALRVALDKHTDEWRDHKMFPVEEPSLLRIEVKTRKNAFTLERGKDKAWMLTQPEKLRADSERVAKMVSTLAGHHAFSFPEGEREKQVRAALEKPHVEARLVPTLGETLRVRITELTTHGVKQVYALSEQGSDSMLGEVDAMALSTLDLGMPELKDKKVLAFENEQVNQIVVRPIAGGHTFKLAKALDSNKWELVEPLPARAKEFKVASLLGSLEKLKAASVGEPQPKSWSRYGIGDTSRSVSLLNRDGGELARLWIGTEVKDNPSRVWARGASGEVLELEKSVIDALPLSLQDVVDDPATAP